MPRWFEWVCAGLVLALLAACGGGTSGTDGGTTQSHTVEFHGVIVGDDNQPVAGVAVAVAQSGDNGVTDAQGQFSVAANLESGEATLILSSPDAEAQVILPEIPDGTGMVELALRLSADGYEASITAIEMKPASEAGTSADDAQDPPLSDVSGQSIIRGVVLDEKGSPLKNWEVRVAGKSYRDVSDKNGAFFLTVPSKAGEVKLFLNSRGITLGVVTPPIPQGDWVVTLTIRVTVPKLSMGLDVTGPQLHPRAVIKSAELTQR